MNIFARPQCPYCGKKVDYITTWMLRRKGEYQCTRCRGVSNVKMDMKTSFLAVGAVLTSFILFLIIYFLFQVKSLKSLFWILLPIFIFYLLSIFLVRLKKPVIKKVPKKKSSSNTVQRNNKSTNSSNINYRNISNNWSSQTDIDQTKII